MAPRLLLALLCLLPVGAAAHNLAPEGGYLMAGVDLGLTIGDEAGAQLGFELSLVELDPSGPWYGIVLGGAWLSDPDTQRLTLAGELGYGFAGIELGASVDTAATVGGRVRGVLTVGVASLYGGLTFGRGYRGELGLLLKAPIEL